MITKADAVAAIEAVTHDLSGEIQFSDAIAAINALPAVIVTDEMVERALEAVGGNPNRTAMRAALEAALPSAPSGKD